MVIFRSGVVAFGATPTYLIQVENVRLDVGIEVAKNYGGASIQPIFAGSLGATPVATFESRALSAALNIIGFDGTVIDPVVFYFPKMAAVGGHAAGATHLSVTLDNCSCYLQTISATQRGEANATFVAYPVYDGSNTPVVVSPSAALPTATQTIEKYTLASIFIGATEYEIEDLTFSTGVNVETRSSKGGLYPSAAVAMSFDPTFEFSTHNMALLDTIGSNATHEPVGKQADDVGIFFRALTNKGAPAADSEAAHLKIAVETSMIQPTDTSASTTSPGTQGFTGHCVYDGTNAIATITAGVAIAGTSPD